MDLVFCLLCSFIPITDNESRRIPLVAEGKAKNLRLAERRFLLKGILLPPPYPPLIKPP